MKIVPVNLRTGTVSNQSYNASQLQKFALIGAHDNRSETAEDVLLGE